MAKEKELSKEEAKAKKDNEKQSQKAQAAKKPKKSVIRFFKEARSEFKKVKWPTRKQLINNTGIVLLSIAASALALWGVDSAFGAILQLILK